MRRMTSWMSMFLASGLLMAGGCRIDDFWVGAAEVARDTAVAEVTAPGTGPAGRILSSIFSLEADNETEKATPAVSGADHQHRLYVVNAFGRVGRDVRASGAYGGNRAG